MKPLRLLHRCLVPQAMPAAAVGYYDRMSEGVAGFYLAPLVEDINAAFGAGISILDVGTGTGHLPVLLARGNGRFRITGLDLSGASIRRAQAHAERAGVSRNIRFIHGGISDIHDRYDLVVSTCSLHHWRSPVRMLRGMGDLLAHSGRLWIMDDSGDAAASERREWVRRVEGAFDAGFLFRTVFNFEIRHLAYREHEIRALCRRARLQVLDFRRRDVFFVADCGGRQ